MILLIIYHPFNQQVIDKAAPTLIDLSDLFSLGDHKRLGDTIFNTLQSVAQSSNPANHTQELLDELVSSRQRVKHEKAMPREDLRIKQAAALVVKLEGNSLFSSGNITGAAKKYSEALEICPLKSKRERVVLYSNRAQCYLLLQQPWLAISDATRALCMHNPVNRHAKSLWRRAQAYDMIGFAKESLLDAILFINECTGSTDPELSVKNAGSKVPDYAERLVKKQMRKAWLFREAAVKHGGVSEDVLLGLGFGQEGDDSEWETASESDIGDDDGNREEDMYLRKGTYHSFTHF
jgi:tetratricopeptide (TPR) repeat protein